MTSGTDWIDQAQHLVEALRARLASVDAAATTEADGSGTRHSADCRWCPICQAAAVVRGERPEVSAALADLLTAAATALRTVAAAGQPPGEPATDGGEQEDPPAPVQQIVIA